MHSALGASALRDSAPRCQDDAILTPSGEHAVVSQRGIL